MIKKIFFTIVFCFGLFRIAHSQVNISGIVNTYAAVTSYDSCNNNCLNVSSATGFSVGDFILVIQMKGMKINETNTSLFGTFVNYDSTGFYEKAVISSISGNQICLVNDLFYKYKISGKVQIVKIARYPTGANIIGNITAPAWNGSTGGIVAIEVLGTLTMNADIDVSGYGFKGGRTWAAISNSCNAFTSVTDYATDSLSWEYKSFKGEGVADYVLNKWSSRGPQANGGGGGNDHNSGGGGGANLTVGGIGGRNNEPGAFNCKGYQPGLGGKGLAMLYKDRIFFGGGGGTGHQNNAVTYSGGNGGGIVYIRANNLIGNNHWIKANGDSSRMGGQDGGSGGGAGGAIKLEIYTITGPLNVAANGGRGASTNNAAANRCFGPGGGGSGGVVYLNSSSVPSGLLIQTLGGAPGVVFNSSNSCNGSSNSATAGNSGVTTYRNNSILICKNGASNCLHRRAQYISTLEEKSMGVYQLNISSLNFKMGNKIIFEKSNDGENFETLKEIELQKNDIIDVQTLDENAFLGNNFYRVQVFNGKNQEYTSETFYMYNGLNWSNEDMIIYPNPTEKQSKVTIVFPSSKEEIAIKIFDLNGKLIQTEALNIDQSVNGQYELNLPKNYFGNLLFIQLASSKGETFTKKLFLH